MVNVHVVAPFRKSVAYVLYDRQGGALPTHAANRLGTPKARKSPSVTCRVRRRFRRFHCSISKEICNVNIAFSAGEFSRIPGILGPWEDPYFNCCFFFCLLITFFFLIVSLLYFNLLLLLVLRVLPVPVFCFRRCVVSQPYVKSHKKRIIFYACKVIVLY